MTGLLILIATGVAAYLAREIAAGVRMLIDTITAEEAE